VRRFRKLSLNFNYTVFHLETEKMYGLLFGIYIPSQENGIQKNGEREKQKEKCFLISFYIAFQNAFSFSEKPQPNTIIFIYPFRKEEKM